MGCACRGRTTEKFLWYNPENPEGDQPMLYNSEVEAKAKVMRKGGVYTTHNPNLSAGQQIVAYEQVRSTTT